jgi:predicted metal-dependent HD superfamily phosphohydrolase
MDVFHRSWARVWAAAAGAGDGAGLRDALLSRYAEPWRHYHTRQHLAECLALFDEFADLAADPAAVELALWFHDAVYDIPGRDNEGRSAAWAQQALAAAGTRAPLPETVRELVLATRHDVAPAGADAALVVDIDLAVLAAAPERFAEYENQIRAEYAYVPRFLFRRKRRAILQGFLDRWAIFATTALHRRFEAAARRNLAAALG